MKKEENEEEKEINFKHWLSRFIILLVIFTALIYTTEITLGIKILSNALMAIAIAVTLGLIHEYLHYYQAVKLGYEPKWYRTKFTMGFEISHHTKRKKWMEDKKKISMLPYYVLLPVSVIIVAIGVYYNIWGIWFGGVMGIALHTVAYPLTEGH